MRLGESPSLEARMARASHPATSVEELAVLVDEFPILVMKNPAVTPALVRRGYKELASSGATLKFLSEFLLALRANPAWDFLLLEEPRLIVDLELHPLALALIFSAFLREAGAQPGKRSYGVGTFRHGDPPAHGEAHVSFRVPKAARLYADEVVRHGLGSGVDELILDEGPTSMATAQVFRTLITVGFAPSANVIFLVDAVAHRWSEAFGLPAKRVPPELMAMLQGEVTCPMPPPRKRRR